MLVLLVLHPFLHLLSQHLPFAFDLFELSLHFGKSRVLLMETLLQLGALEFEGLGFINLLSQHLVELLLHALDMELELLFYTDVGTHIGF